MGHFCGGRLGRVRSEMVTCKGSSEPRLSCPLLGPGDMWWHEKKSWVGAAVALLSVGAAGYCPPSRGAAALRKQKPRPQVRLGGLWPRTACPARQHDLCWFFCLSQGAILTTMLATRNFSGTCVKAPAPCLLFPLWN